ncbi:transcription factor Ouib-like [Drosophila tropicalis]|uniref:transcription factor Ouib-like n=1 Tax=Drosophila tropicalis TaxID=46794 RepID=UPI0035ABE61E
MLVASISVNDLVPFFGTSQLLCSGPLGCFCLLFILLFVLLIKMSNHCRTCSEMIHNKTGKNLFQEPHSIKLHRIQALTGLWISEHPEFPNFICGPCEVALGKAIDFRELIIMTQKKLLTQRKEVDVFDEKVPVEAELDPEDFVIHEEECSINEDKQADGEVTSTLSLSTNGSLKFDNSQSKKMPRIQWSKLTENDEVALKRERRKRDCICDMCGRHFSCQSNFRVHLLRHTGIKNYQCSQCSQTFYTAHLLRRHERTHVSVRPYQCHYCNLSFTNTGGRIQHERTHHTFIKPFKCKECDQSFVTGSKLSRHMLSHTRIRSFHCDSCKVSFLRRSHLSAHFRSKSHAQSIDKQAMFNLNVDTELATSQSF